ASSLHNSIPRLQISEVQSHRVPASAGMTVKSEAPGPPALQTAASRSRPRPKQKQAHGTMDTPVIEVRIWDQRVGAVAPVPQAGCHAFEYDPSWRRQGIDLAPLTMPLDAAGEVFLFPDLPRNSFHGLPGLLADALPDVFGNA